MEKTYFRKENYCKYNAVSARLLEDLHAGKTAKESARALGISLPTYYKYKGLVSAENGQVYILPEERKFLQEKALPAGAAMKNGGGNKPVSDKQLKLIRKLCANTGQNLNVLIMQFKNVLIMQFKNVLIMQFKSEYHIRILVTLIYENNRKRRLLFW